MGGMSTSAPASIFEAFGELARRALFFARFSLTQRGGAEIDEVHLLLGVLAGSPEAVTQFTDAAWPEDRVTQALHDLSPHEPRLPTATPIPFSRSVTDAIVAAGVRPRAQGRQIVPEHLVWAVMQEPSTPAAALLAEAGVTRVAIEAFLDRP